MPILKNVTGKKLVVHEEIKEKEWKKKVLQMIPRQLSPRNDEGTPHHVVYTFRMRSRMTVRTDGGDSFLYYVVIKFVAPFICPHQIFNPKPPPPYTSRIIPTFS